jgi:hypothetical protein
MVQHRESGRTDEADVADRVHAGVLVAELAKG